MRMNLARGLVLCFMMVAAFTLAISMSTRAGESVAENPYMSNADAISEGGDLFDEYCSECHGDGTGGTGPDLTDSEWLYGNSNADLYQSITSGRPGGMPAMQYDMNKEEILKVIAFVNSIKK